MAFTPIDPTDNMPQTRVKINNMLDEVETRVALAETNLDTASFVTLAGDQTITGAKTFSSASGITLDNATGQIKKADNTGFIGLSSGTSTNSGGANIGMWGSGHATASTGRLRTDGTTRLEWNTTGVTVAQALTLSTAGTTTSHAVRADRQVLAGNGLTGGGNLTSNKSITLGTPGTLTTATTNGVTASSHTHAITAADGFLPAIAAGANVVTNLYTNTTNHQATVEGSRTSAEKVVKTFTMVRGGSVRAYISHRRTGGVGSVTTYVYKNGTVVTSWTNSTTTNANQSTDISVQVGDEISIRQTVYYSGALPGVVEGESTGSLRITTTRANTRVGVAA